MSPYLQWLVRILWSRRSEVAVSLGPNIPRGRRVVERYLALPGAARCRFLVPVGTQAASVAALTAYNDLRPPGTRAVRRLVSAGLRTGILDRLVGDQITVSVPRSISDEDLPSLLLREHLRSALGGDRLLLGIGLRRPGPLTKPVLQAFDRLGAPRGYVKVGWNEVTRALVGSEARFLAGKPPLGTLRIPALLHHGSWRDLEVTVAAPLPQGVRRYRSSHLPPPEPTREVAAIGGLWEERLAGSPYWEALRRALAGPVEEVRAREVVLGCLSRIEQRYGHLTLRFGTWHGDWVPWNLAVQDGLLWAWDWEHARDGVPYGFDALHFVFQIPFVGEQRDLGQTLARWRRLGPAALATLGVEEDRRPALMATYLLELFARYHWAERSGAGRKERFYPRILDFLAGEAAG